MILVCDYYVRTFLTSGVATIVGAQDTKDALSIYGTFAKGIGTPNRSV